MFRTCALSALLACALLTGCVQSLHPYYTDEQLTYDAALIGTWTSDDGENTVVITGDAENKSYHAVYTDEDKKRGKFDVHLAKVNEHLLVDIAPAEPEREDESDMYQIHLLPVHSFMLLERDGDDTLKLRQMDYDWLKEYLEKNPQAIAHEKVGGDRILLIAPSEKVQAFVLAHVKTEDAYEEALVLKRVKNTTTAPAATP